MLWLCTFLLLLSCLLLASTSSAFMVVPHPSSSSAASMLSMASIETTERSRTAAQALRVPLTWDEMVRQVASAIKGDASQGHTRQIVRLLLPRDVRSNDFGKLFESSDDLSQSVLVPPDESWQGGIMQLYRAAKPTTEAILRKLAADGSGFPSRVKEDRSVDESGVDGIGRFETEDGNVLCWLQPTQEIVDQIVATAKKDGDGVQILLNPQWRTVDDALDTYSQGEGFLSGLASFLGGKGDALKSLAQAGFKPVYSFEGYVCRGSNIRLLQVQDSDWAVFCERDDQESFVSIGTLSTRPTYQQVDEMLQKADIGYKYARDIGLSPKL